ncbi:MAG: tetratricopeptide repeat protein [Pseudomonadota bacterium]
MSTLIEVSEFELWWKKHQKVLRGIAAVILVAGAAYTVYTQQRNARLDSAATLLAAADAGAENKNAVALQGAAEQLQTQHPETHHASLALLQLARFQADQKQFKESEASAKWVIEHAPLPVFKDVANLHIAQLKIQQQDWNAAIATLSQPFSDESYKATANELLADVNAIRGNLVNARSQYTKALNTQPQGHPYRDMIQHKLDSLTQ